MTKKRNHGPEDEDEAPDEQQPEEAAPAQPLAPSEFDAQGKTWDDSYTAATDHPGHPLGHLKGV